MFRTWSGQRPRKNENDKPTLTGKSQSVPPILQTPSPWDDIQMTVAGASGATSREDLRHRFLGRYRGPFKSLLLEPLGRPSGAAFIRRTSSCNSEAAWSAMCC